MSFGDDYDHERPSDSPVALEVTTGAYDPRFAVLADRLGFPRAWLGMTAYLAAGIVLGLVLIVALSIGRRSDAAAATMPADAVTDNIVRLHSREIGNSCWQGFEKLGPARLTVAVEVGVDGKIRYAAASGETTAMRGCVEAHVKSWEFLPQSQAQALALPIEVDRR